MEVSGHTDSTTGGDGTGSRHRDHQRSRYRPEATMITCPGPPRTSPTTLRKRRSKLGTGRVEGTDERRLITWPEPQRCTGTGERVVTGVDRRDRRRRLHPEASTPTKSWRQQTHQNPDVGNHRRMLEQTVTTRRQRSRGEPGGAAGGRSRRPEHPLPRDRCVEPDSSGPHGPHVTTPRRGRWQHRRHDSGSSCVVRPTCVVGRRRPSPARGHGVGLAPAVPGQPRAVGRERLADLAELFGTR